MSGYYSHRDLRTFLEPRSHDFSMRSRPHRYDVRVTPYRRPYSEQQLAHRDSNRSYNRPNRHHTSTFNNSAHRDSNRSYNRPRHHASTFNNSEQLLEHRDSNRSYNRPNHHHAATSNNFAPRLPYSRSIPSQSLHMRLHAKIHGFHARLFHTVSLRL